MRLEQLRRHERELGFAPQEQVRWLSPRELWRTALKVGLSWAFAGYWDKRETQAALTAGPLAVEAGPDGDCWFDFVADLGDGFDPTYTVALMVAAETLDVDGGGRLPRGRLLVLGGDEIYPTASAAGYENRLRGPYRLALPESAAQPELQPEHDAGMPVVAAEGEPVMLAVPGNHDWYDGLTAFLRVFSQQRRIGGWRTRQGRSYFVAQLPHGWWLVGLDTQLGTEIDDPQRMFFEEHLSARLAGGDSVIVCSPTPTWVYSQRRDPDAFNTLHWFERHIVNNRIWRGTERSEPTGATVRLWLTGDLHHYARYAEHGGEPEARQMVTCGLGGAFLASTHRLPERLEVPPEASSLTGKDSPSRFDLAARYPDAATSRRLSLGLLWPSPRGLPFRNPGFWPVAAALHGGLLLALASILGLYRTGSGPATAIRTAPVQDVGALALQALVWFAVVLALVVLSPLRRLRLPRLPPLITFALGLQLAVGFGGLAVIVLLPWQPGWPDWVVLGLSLVVTGFGTALVGSFAFALYIAVARDGQVAEWQMSAQSIEERKGFLRFRLGADGRLTMFPLVLDRVSHNWDLQPAAAGEERPRVVPVDGAPVPRLAEPPVVIARTPSA